MLVGKRPKRRLFGCCRIHTFESQLSGFSGISHASNLPVCRDRTKLQIYTDSSV